MKVQELFESEDEPIVLDIIRGLLKKGSVVRVFYRGDGGRLNGIDYDRDANLVKFMTDSGSIMVHPSRIEQMELRPREMRYSGKVQKVHTLKVYNENS